MIEISMVHCRRVIAASVSGCRAGSVCADGPRSGPSDRLDDTTASSFANHLLGNGGRCGALLFPVLAIHKGRLLRPAGQ